VNFNNIKNISPGPNLGRRILAVCLCCAVLWISYVMLKKAGRDAVDTVDVVRIKRDGISARTMLTKNMVEKYALLKREFNQDMVAYRDFEKIDGNFTLHFMRGHTVVHYDQVTERKPLKNEWLYQLKPEYEILTVPYNYLECGGDILTPGDRIRVRISYDASEPQAFPIGAGASSFARNDTAVTEVLFDDIKVVDLLNARGHSIYEVYQEVLKLPEQKKQETLKSQNFLNNILPRSFVLEATSDQAERFARYGNKKNLNYTFSILSRQGNSDIVDGIVFMKEEVESWTEGKK
jgi:hypothetical protein